jgi:hypothetical protein
LSDEFLDQPNIVAYSRCHSRSDPERSVNPAQIVIREVECECPEEMEALLS